MTNEEKIYHKDNWNQHIGRIWNDVFKITCFPKTGTIIEVAPGNVNKLGEGLYQYGFEGQLFVIEPNKNALKSITNQYQKQLTKTKIIPIQQTLTEAISHLPQCDAIVSNHPLDDMIIGESLNTELFNDLFNDHYNSPAIELTRKYWEILESDCRRLECAKEKVLEDWKNLMLKTNPKIAILSQYESYSFQSMNIKQPDTHAIDVLNKIRKNYSNCDKSNVLKNIPGITNHMHWLVLKN